MSVCTVFRYIKYLLRVLLMIGLELGINTNFVRTLVDTFLHPFFQNPERKHREGVINKSKVISVMYKSWA